MTDAPAVARGRLWLRLDEDPKDFDVPRLAALLEALAMRVDADASVFNVVDIRSGCVIIVLDVPEVQLKALMASLRPSIEPSTSLDELTREFHLQGVRRDEPEELSTFSLRRDSSPALAWLHVSDLHVEDGGNGQKRWMETVERDLPKLLADHRLNPDFVLVSGDVASSGAAAQYEEALQFFERLREKLPRRHARWVIAPGNHDVDWDAVDEATELKIRARIAALRDDESLASELDSPSTASYLRARQANFKVFAGKASARIDAPVVSDDNTAVLKLNIGDIDVGIASLNSSLLSTRKDLAGSDDLARISVPDLDLQHLALGSEQLRAAVGAVEDCDVRVALLHHPPLSEWFAPLDHVAQRTYLGEFDFVHRGHEHMPSQTRRCLAGVRDDVFEVAAGALYTSAKWFRGFCVVALDPAAGFVQTQYFSFGSRANRWMPDGEIADRGLVLTPMPPRLRKRLRTKGSVASAPRSGVSRAV